VEVKKIILAIEGLENDVVKLNTTANSISDRLDLLKGQIEENTQILKRLLLLSEDSKEAHDKVISDSVDKRDLKHKLSRIRVKTSVTPLIMQTPGTSQSKRIIVNVDYDPKKDFALIAFKRKMENLWKKF